VAEEETRSERLNRELDQLLQELRVVLPGVQVLLAFLLTAPFQQRFAQLAPILREVYFASICCAVVAVVLLLAPTTHHRLRFQKGEKERLVQVANRLAVWGTGFLAAAIVLALYDITRVLFEAALAAVATAAGAAVLFLLIWYVVPFAGPAARDRDRAGAARDSG
jgi:hypothetical protein